MSLLDAAKRLAENNGQAGLWDNLGGHMGCPICDKDDGEHTADCPWLAMPQIVALIEAAERLTPWLRARCIVASCPRFADDDTPHADDCEGQALVAALKGEKVPA